MLDWFPLLKTLLFWMCLLCLPSVLIWINTKTCQICLIHSRTSAFLPPITIVELHVLNQFRVLLFGLLTSCFSLHNVTARVCTQGAPLTNGICVIWALLWMPCSVALSPAKQRFPTCSTLKTDCRQNLQRSFQTKLNCEPIVCVGL